MDPERVERIERDLEGLRAVRAARIRADGDEIQEVHIIALPGRDVKGIVRDVITTLYAGHRIRLNFRKVSVAVLGQAQMQASQDGTTTAESGAPRIEYVSVNSMVQGPRVETQVELSWPGGSLLGTQTGASTPESRLRLVAEATLDAMQQATREGCHWSLGDIALLRLGQGEAVAAKVCRLQGRTRQELAGCALVAGHLDEAVVFAILQATNRAAPRHLRPIWTEYEITSGAGRQEEIVPEPEAEGGG